MTEPIRRGDTSVGWRVFFGIFAVLRLLETLGELSRGEKSEAAADLVPTLLWSFLAARQPGWPRWIEWLFLALAAVYIFYELVRLAGI